MSSFDNLLIDKDSKTNYVAAWLDWYKSQVVVLERDNTDGRLFQKTYNAPYYFYVEDSDGKDITITNKKVTKIECEKYDDFKNLKTQFENRGKKLYEIDFNPVKRVLMDNYYKKKAPILNYCFLDIEVDYIEEDGAQPVYPTAFDPFGEITAFTVYQSWTKKYKVVALSPLLEDGTYWIDNHSVLEIYDYINIQIEKGNLRKNLIPDIEIVKTEVELCHKLIEYTKEADLLSGWNSRLYDIPYIVSRFDRIGGENLVRQLEYPMCNSLPKRTEIISDFGRPEIVYEFAGKSPIDYMDAYKKFIKDGRESYSLNSILELEVKVGKLEMPYSLKKTYHSAFPIYVAYNFRDVDGLVQLDEKRKFISLINQMSHDSTTLFAATLKTVESTETALSNHAHYKFKQAVVNKNSGQVSTGKIEGGIVLTPKKSKKRHVGSVDLNSLYPTIIRKLNISIEKIVGQFTGQQKDWEEIKTNKNPHKVLSLTLNDGETLNATVSDWNRVILESDYCVTAFGTIMDMSSGLGVLPDLLTEWYNDRKKLQAEEKKYAKKKNEILSLLKDISNHDTIEYKNLFKELEEVKKLEEYYYLLQLTKKIQLNAAYGALLSPSFRFGDYRLGASTTASGRATTSHMIKTISQYLNTNSMAEVVKTTTIDKDGEEVHSYDIADENIFYSDTDSAYFQLFPKYGTDIDSYCKFADEVADVVNQSFPEFVKEAFLCHKDFGAVIKVSREIYGLVAIFQAKKKYIIKLLDKEGQRVFEEGKDIKSQGSEIIKVDTPKIIRKFLKDVMYLIFDDASHEEIEKFILSERKRIFKNKELLWKIGVVKQVNNMEKFINEYNNPGSERNDKGNKLTVPGGVRSALNYNSIIKELHSNEKVITSGSKVYLFKLKNNNYDFKEIAIPTDYSDFPSWFFDYFSIDTKLIEEKMIDQKLKGIFENLGEEIPTFQSKLNNSIIKF